MFAASAAASVAPWAVVARHIAEFSEAVFIHL